jgi:NADH dehydrogenase
MTVRSVTVVVVGADGDVGRALRMAINRLPNRIRPVRRGDDLAAACRGADVVVHLAGSMRPRCPDTYRTANLDTVAATVAAARGSGVRRLVHLSYLGADPDSGNPYLAWQGRAEELVRSADVPSVVLRTAHIIGPPAEPGPTAAALLARGGRPVTVFGTGHQRYAWVARQDVVEVLRHAALDPDTPTGTFDLAGPEALTVDDTVRLLNGPAVRIRHVPPAAARLLGRLHPELSHPLIDVLLRDCVPAGDPRRTAARFGAVLRPFRRVVPG